MSRLATQQQALLAALFDWPPDDAMHNIASYACLERARGLKTYKSNGHALAQRALQAAYPVLAQLLGAESFAALASAYWHASPPACGDVTQWGAGLPDFVRGSAQLQDEPYLGDVAVLEWAVHGATNAADATVDAPSFALLADHDPAHLHLQLSPGCGALASDWPVASIWAAHVDQSVSFDAVRQRLQANQPECALVWRAGLQAQVGQISATEQLFLTQLLAGHSLGAALEAVPNVSPSPDTAAAWDINVWLGQAVQSGLLLGVQWLPSKLSHQELRA